MTKAVILSAGFGTRLHAITDRSPKPLISIDGEPVIKHIINHLNKNGVTKVAVNLHYMPLHIIRELQDRDIKFFGEVKPLGTAGALRPMEKWLSDPFVACNGDTVTNVNIKKMLSFHKEKNALITVFTNDDVIHSGGTYVISKRVLDLIPSRKEYSIHEDLLPSMYAKYSKKIQEYKDGWYIDIGTQKGLREARAYFAKP